VQAHPTHLKPADLKPLGRERHGRRRSTGTYTNAFKHTRRGMQQKNMDRIGVKVKVTHYGQTRHSARQTSCTATTENVLLVQTRSMGSHALACACSVRMHSCARLRPMSTLPHPAHFASCSSDKPPPCGQGRTFDVTKDQGPMANVRPAPSCVPPSPQAV